MKRLSFQFAVVFGLLGALGLVMIAPGRGNAAAGRAAQPAGPVKIAVLDMSYLFRNYEKFEVLRQGVKEAADAAQAKAKGYIDQARSIEEQLKSGEFENGSPEFLERENKVIQLSSRFEVFKATAAKEIKKKDAEVVAAIYDDVRHALSLFAEQNGYTLILQINRDALASEDKAKVSQKLSQSVFHNHDAEDITEAVLAYLSQAYAAETGAAESNPRPAKQAKAAPPASTPTAAKAPTATPQRGAAPSRSAAAPAKTSRK